LKLDKVAAAFQAKGFTIPSDVKQTLLVRNEKNQPSSKWYLTDLTTMKHYELVKNGDKITVSLEAQLYVAPQATQIGTINFPQDFYINGKIEFLFFNLETTINIDPNQGIAIDAQMDKIVIGHEHLFSLKALEGDGGPNLSVATYTQPDQKVEELKSPHFYINGQLEMLGISRGAFVSLTKKWIRVLSRW
jgi:hypothetical protein